MQVHVFLLGANNNTKGTKEYEVGILLRQSTVASLVYGIEFYD